MPTYNLDSSPNLYVGCPSYSNPNDLIYIRDFTNEPSATEIALLDPKSEDDVLVVYGTEIKGDLLRKLGKCTQLQRRSGSIRVNCNGACYFGAGGPWYRTVDNVIFDWSLFGVTVPNSANELLRSQLDQKDKMIEELKTQLAQKESHGEKDDLREAKTSCMVSEVESIKAEVESMSKTLLEHSKELRDKGLELQRMSQRVSTLGRELDHTKVKLEHSLSVSSLMQEAMNCAKNESNWYRQEITALRMEISQHGRVSRR